MSVDTIGRQRRLVRTYPTSLERAWELLQVAAAEVDA